MEQKNNQNFKKRNNKSKSQFQLKIRWQAIVGLLLVFLLLSVATYLFWSNRLAFFKMEKLDQELVDLRSAMNIDSVRQYKIQKIMKIIKQYNSTLSSAEIYDIANEIYEMSVKYTNLNEDLLCALITHESASSWDPGVISPAGAMGLMQIMPVTGLFLAEYEGISWTEPEDVLFNPVYNIRMGCRLLSTLINRYELEGGLAAYNGGEKQAAIWIANGKDDQFLWKETRGYIPAIQKLYDQYLSQTL